ncbi:Alpha/Beta hydrolase protein [Apiospora arundinis]|uniref:Alpha/Beta hydrolase protein n=1 Tax=Apiospora arundinis TaxID=335852 RepID=A0ABR2IXU4_9PEZI
MKGNQPEGGSQPLKRRKPFTVPNFVWQSIIVPELVYLLYPTLWSLPANCHGSSLSSPFGRFPHAEDPFRFIPCTDTSLPSFLFDPNPDHWSWGNRTSSSSITTEQQDDPHAGRNIYMCGYRCPAQLHQQVRFAHREARCNQVPGLGSFGRDD